MSSSKSCAPEATLLAQPLRLPNGGLLRNRLARSAMSETLATYDNHATARPVGLYRRWAASGIGLLFTGNVMIDRRAIGEPGNVVIEDESDLPVLQPWARAATDQGAALSVQLNHPGKQSPKGLNVGNLAPSTVPFREDMAAFFETPREATNAEIHDIIRRSSPDPDTGRDLVEWCTGNGGIRTLESGATAPAASGGPWRRSRCVR